MFGFILCIFVICLISWLYLYWMNLRDYWRKRGIPHLPPHPILGSLTFLQRKNTALWMIDLYQQLKSPYIGIWLFWRPALILNSPELIKKVLVKDFASFRNRFLQPGSRDPLRHTLFTADDPLWSSIRRYLTTVFTSSKLRALQYIFDLKTKELIQRINNCEDKSKINIRMLVTDYTTDVIATASFGVKTTATLTGEDPIRTVTKTFMDFDLYRGICWSTIFFFPKLADILRFPVFPKWSTDYFRKVFLAVSEQRKQEKEIKGFNESKDLLDALLKLKEEGTENGEVYSDDVILAQAVVFLFGGYETSGSTLSFALYELAFHPEIQDKIYAEVLEAKEKRPNGHLDMSTLADLTYLNCVITETLRKYPPLGWLDRVALNDYKIDDNLIIPKGMPIYINSIGMHYDSDYFPEPEKFNPDRFLPENEQDIESFSYLPFGEGPRNCIGKRFGQITVRSALSNLILNYKLVPLPGAKKPSEVEFEKQSLFLLPGQDLYIDFVPRQS